MKNSVRCHSVRLVRSSRNRVNYYYAQFYVDVTTIVATIHRFQLISHRNWWITFGITHDLFLSIYLLASIRWSAAYYSRIVWLYLIQRACIWYVACVVVFFSFFFLFFFVFFADYYYYRGRWSVYAKDSLCIFKQDYMN